MYKRAREAEKKGKAVTDVPIREMTVYKAEVLDSKNIVVNHDIGEITKDGNTELKNTTIYRSKEGSRVVVTVRFFVAVECIFGILSCLPLTLYRYCSILFYGRTDT